MERKYVIGWCDMDTKLSMRRLAPGMRAEVLSLGAEDGMRRRFLDLGLAEGSEIECVGRSPAGDPSAYLIRGAVVAIRAADCEGILVRLLPGGG